MRQVAVPPITLEAYQAIVSEETREFFATWGRELRDVRVIHINAAPAGDGVAEILKSLAGLMQGIDLDAQWYVLEPDPDFCQITKKLHHGRGHDRVG